MCIIFCKAVKGQYLLSIIPSSYYAPNYFVDQAKVSLITPYGSAQTNLGHQFNSSFTPMITAHSSNPEAYYLIF